MFLSACVSILIPAVIWEAISEVDRARRVSIHPKTVSEDGTLLYDEALLGVAKSLRRQRTTSISFKTSKSSKSS